MLISILGYNMADNQIDPLVCMAKLNEHCQKNFLQLEYREIYNKASSHDHLFTVAVVIDKVQYESATGKTKKEARALAAVLAWNTIQEQKKVSGGVPTDQDLNHSSPIFSYACQIGDKVFDVGRGNKVKTAKKEAAKLAYEKLTRSSTFRAEECPNPFSDSSDVTSSSSQSLSNEASGSSTDLDLELEKTSDTLTEHADAISLNETSSSQNAVSPPSQSVKPKRKETPSAPKFSDLSTRTSKFTKNDRFLQDFVDIEEIGSGGFGNVFKAKNTIDRRLCAIKRILSNKTEDETREVKALAILDHPHIVRYYNCWSGEDIFQSPVTGKSSSLKFNCLFIQMELCEKGNLSDWLDQKKGHSCKSVSIILFQQIVEGVDYIHSKNLIHRDLKPLNVFFHDENHIKIGDFGLVTVGVTDRQRTMNKGTWNYMAPEQEGSNYDKKVDIFPLGLILYEMLSPFYTGSEKCQEWPNIKEGKLPKTFTRKFTKETSLIKQLLSKEPSQRPSAADILRILKGQPHTLHTC
ncbi:interferon-induced, double-stranded RNA-activated protein kinase [Pseudonaja textilis]|uniref:interferon-induced, double-stranded RNA-activated protein kinase n=1 Tax=Pseudonaja textilis TaxID=8673 RepID=UPI000EAA9BE6|nr:interferon-induced, double-stranded RNA-activated protein kinase [Pseudonaja textilis]